MATKRNDFVFPTPPVAVCPTCGEPVKPVAVADADGWYVFGYDCENYCEAIDDSRDHEWPFVEDTATAIDFEAIGFMAVNA